MRSIPTTLLILAALALPAAAGDPFGSGARHGTGGHRGTGIHSPGHAGRHSADALHRFTARRQAEAGVRLLEQRRDLERRSIESRLQRRGTRSQVRAYRARVEATERADDVRVRRRLAEADPAWWDGLGPNTRRVLERSRIAVRRAERRQDLRRELDALEREAETREAPSTW